MTSRTEAALVGTAATAAGLIALAVVYVTGRYAWVVAFVIGAVLIIYGIRALHRAASVRSWPKVQGRVLAVSLGEVFVPSKGGGHIEYYPVVEFEYASPGGRFTSDRFTIAPRDHRNIVRAEPERLLVPYPVGAAVEVRVCPRDPRLAVLCAEVSRKRRSHYLASLVAGVLVCAIALWVALSGTAP